MIFVLFPILKHFLKTKHSQLCKKVKRLILPHLPILYMGKIADYLKNYNNASTAGGYSSAVYTFLDFIYGKQRKGVMVTSDEKRQYE